MDKRYYLAYGSNLNIRQMHMRCPTARIVGTAFIKGYELLFKGSKTGSYLTIERKEGSKVPVAVWTVEPSDEQRLDAYEGFPHFYYKKELRVPVKEIRTGIIRNHDTFAYIMHEQRSLGIPSDSYFNTCCCGYDFFKFDCRYLEEAYLKSEVSENEEQ